jgi:7-cyano-7-deazaguanine synthase
MSSLDPTHCLVVLSGGQDSTTCLFWALAHYDRVSAITFNYGQRHARELQAAADVWKLAQHAAEGVEFGAHLTLAVGPILESTSPLVSAAELEQYQDFNSLPGGLEKTFVPMRNQLFLTLAANRAVAIGAADIITGVCQEDFGGYPDCRQVFIDSLQDTINLGLGLQDTEAEFNTIALVTPLMDLTKADTVELAVEFGGYAALAFSHTSYDGQYPPTGHDHATLLRAKGFAEAKMADPLVLRAAMEDLMPWPDFAKPETCVKIRSLSLALDRPLK